MGIRQSCSFPRLREPSTRWGVGDQPGRLGEGRNRIHRAATKCDPNINTANIHLGTKKRPMLCIVVSCLPAVFHWLMFIDYQIRLNFASGVGLKNVGEMNT